MVVQVSEQIAVLPQPLLEPGTVVVVELDDLLVNRPFDLAHVLQITPARSGRGRGGRIKPDLALSSSGSGRGTRCSRPGPRNLKEGPEWTVQ